MSQQRGQRVADVDALDRYRRLIEGSGVGLFQTTRDGAIRWVNPAAAAIVGYSSPQEFMSSVDDIREIYVEPHRRDEFAREIDETGSTSHFDYEIKRRDGAIRWIEVAARPVISDQDGVELFEGTVTDVTDRKLMEIALGAIASELDPTEAIAGFAGVLKRFIPYQQLSFAVIEGDYYRRAVSVSGSGEMQPFPLEELVPLQGNSMGKVVASAQPVIVPDTASGEWEFDRVLRERGVASYAIFPLIDDKVFATFNIGFAHENGFPDDVVRLITSITGSVANAVKKILLVEAEREAHRRLAEAHRLRNDFLAQVAHDLRSPLGIISGIAEITHDHWDAIDDATRRERLVVIRRQAGRMNDLITRDLDVALIDSGDVVVRKEPLDLAEALREWLDDVATGHPERSFVLRAGSDLPRALADPDRLQQILGNLIANAIKFSEPGTTITVAVAAAGSEVQIDVTDQGVGIPEEHRDHVFDKLTRLDRGREGSGLGLYIARSLVELLGGRIWLTGGPEGDGSTFSFTLPVAASDEG